MLSHPTFEEHRLFHFPDLWAGKWRLLALLGAYESMGQSKRAASSWAHGTVTV